MRYRVSFEFDAATADDILHPTEWDWEYVLRDFNCGFDIVKDIDSIVVEEV